HLAAQRIGYADHRRLAHVGVPEQHVLDLDGAHRPTGRDDDVVGPSGVVEVAIAVHVASILRRKPGSATPHLDLADLVRRRGLPAGALPLDAPGGNRLAEPPGL